jgi:hypothetical protein
MTGISTIAASSLSTAGGVVYSDGTNLQDTVSGTSGQALISGGAAAPTWYAPTATRVLFAGTGGILADDAGITYNSTTDALTVAGNLVIDDNLIYLGNRVGTANTFLGFDAGSTTTVLSERNVGVGYQALLNSDGSNNVGIGYQALVGNTSGAGNVGLGSGANRSNLIGVNNMAIGLEALFLNTGSYNVAIGQGALYNQQGADNNVAIGRQALVLNVTGTNNLAMGYEAGYSSLGSGNVYLGFRAGYNETGSNKLYIDNSTDATPLIGGDFSTDTVTIDGTLAVTTLSTSGGVIYNDGTNLVDSSAGTTGQALISGGTGAPTWFAPTAGSVLFAGPSGILSQDNTHLYFDDTNNRLGVGFSGSVNTIVLNGTTYGSTFTVNTEGATDVAESSFHRHSNTAALGANLIGLRSRGTQATSTVVQSADNLLRFIAVGHDGTDYEQAASIEMVVDGTPGNNDMPGAIQLKTTPDGATAPVTRITIENDGDVNFDGSGMTYAASTNNLVVGGSITSNALTNTRVLFAGASGLITDDAGMVYDNTNNRLTVDQAVVSDLGDNYVVFGGTSGRLESEADFQWDSATNQLGLSAAGQVRFYDSAGGEYSALRASGTTTSSVVYSLPAADGSAGQLLRTDGSGGLSWVTNTGSITFATIRDAKADTTNGGTFTSGAWRTRDLNTLVGDTTNVSLATNQFTLTAGTYLVEWSAPAYLVDANQTKLYNVTDTADVVLGTVEYANASNFMAKSVGAYTFTIASSKTYEIRHISQSTQLNTGFGRPGSLGSGEVYTEVRITRYP